MNDLSAIAAIVIFIGFLIFKIHRKETIDLSDMVMVIIAARIMPIAISLTLFPLLPELIDPLENMDLEITLTGLVLVLVYSKTIIEKLFNSS